MQALKNRRTLAKLMLIQGASQMDVARAAGWNSHTSVGRLVRGEWTNVTDDVAQKISAHLDVSVTDLFVPAVSTPTGRNAQSDCAA